jgi:hypothetical protein
MARLIVGLVGTLLFGVGQLRAQQVESVGSAGVAVGVIAAQGFPATQRPGQVPPRDAQQAPPGTATLRGRVYAGDTGQPLRKAQVRIFSTNPGAGGGIVSPENRLAMTDGSGRFEFDHVRAGRYTVTVQKAGYVNLSFGQQRQNDAAKPIDVLDGLTIEKIDISLPRGGVITGRILDEFGDPVADVQVGAVRNLYTGGSRRLVPAGRMGTTNDIGEFRLAALPPGEYYVSATYRNFNVSPQEDTNDRGGYAPTYYPGTPDLSSAQKVAVAIGQTVNDITLALLPVRTARVSGTAVDSRGQALRGVVIAAPRGGLQFGGFASQPGQIRPDGSFAMTGLTPGDYTLQVQGQAVNGPDAEYASTEVTVAGVDLTNVRIVSVKPSTITGRVVFASGDPASLKASTVRLIVQPAFIGGPLLGPFPPPAAPHDDWSFQSSARAGMVRVALQGLPAGRWNLKAVRHHGVDITDSGLEVRPGEDLSDVEVVMTDQIASLSGLVTNGRGDTVKDYWTVVFARDRDKWAAGRYVRMSRGDQDGRFRFTGLPAAEYLAIAVDSLDPGEVNDPEFLTRAETRASRFSIGEGETKTLDLKLNSRP